ncbi:MAG: HypC/HybG/HupF family hydrogenase formation chaperone [Candidatus Binataceae bacterium]
MCLGIPGRITSIDTEYRDLGEVDVAGVTRKINFGILENSPSIGDWILIQSGFAIEVIDEERARTQMELLNRYTGGPPMDDGTIESAEADFDWDTMTPTRSNPGTQDK